MPTHAHFEELCVLATSGQLCASESDALNEHLLECDNCRAFLKDAHFISDRVIPKALQTPRGEVRVPAGIRERFLELAKKEGLQIHAGPPVASEEVPVEAEPVAALASPSRRFLDLHILLGTIPPWRTWAVGASACVAFFALGAMIGTSYLAGSHKGTTDAAASPSSTAQAAPAPDINHERVQVLTAEHDQLTRQIADLASQLKTVQREKKEVEASLQQQLSVAQSEAARDHDALAQQTVSLNARAVDLQSQLDTARQQESLADADLKNARAKTVEYSARLDLLQSQLRNQEAPLPSADEVSSLVAARNLHIIDVYDSNTTGQRQRAFGRVFYVEGRSLVFYAYDLAATHAQKNITFHLWGEKAGSKETTLSLGVLHDDDPKERRWALTLDDPKVLAKINSVYVTAETASKQSDAPRGPRVLYAYFGAQPNHP